jgi:hypothetical protein
MMPEKGKTSLTTFPSPSGRIYNDSPAARVLDTYIPIYIDILSTFKNRETGSKP